MRGPVTRYRAEPTLSTTVGGDETPPHGVGGGGSPAGGRVDTAFTGGTWLGPEGSNLTPDANVHGFTGLRSSTVGNLGLVPLRQREPRAPFFI